MFVSVDRSANHIGRTGTGACSHIIHSYIFNATRYSTVQVPRFRAVVTQMAWFTIYRIRMAENAPRVVVTQAEILQCKLQNLVDMQDTSPRATASSHMHLPEEQGQVGGDLVYAEGVRTEIFVTERTSRR